MSEGGLEVIRSNKGHNKVIYLGYMYTKHKAMGDKIRWRCVQRASFCKGSIFTSGEFTEPRVTVNHNHEPDFDAVEFARSRTMFADRLALFPMKSDVEDISDFLLNDDGVDDQPSTSTATELYRSISTKKHRKQASSNETQRSVVRPIAPRPRLQTPTQFPQAPPPQVCLRWNSYHSNMQASFPCLLNNEQYVDVTLACQGKSIKCHKMILSACSTYFDELLSANPCQHPIILMRDMKFWEVQALVDFMYCGEVNVAQDKLPSLLAAAEALQIKGLAAMPTSQVDDKEEELVNEKPVFLEAQPSSRSTSGARRARKRQNNSNKSVPPLRRYSSPSEPMQRKRKCEPTPDNMHKEIKLEPLEASDGVENLPEPPDENITFNESPNTPIINQDCLLDAIATQMEDHDNDVSSDEMTSHG